MLLSQIKSPVTKFGYYRVGDEIITNKVRALLRASQTGKHPSWHFHHDVYSQLDWNKDPDMDLSQIYQMRACQLREKYDYIVINFSGGSDSWTIIKSFFDAGLPVDEIFCRWPVSATVGKFRVDQHDKHASNILSEWQLTIQPALAEIKNWFPKATITIHDWSENFFRDEITDDTWLDSMPNDYLNPGALPKATAQSLLEKTRIGAGVRTAVIDGIDKPQIFYEDGRLYCYFLDKLANAHAPETDGRVVEHFYWSPDLPGVTWAQSRAIYRSVIHRPDIVRLIDRSLPYDLNRKKIWNTFTRSVIYPDYCARNFFQADKSYTNVYDEVDSWMFVDDFRHARFLASWHNVLGNIINSIDPKYFDRRQDEILGFCGFIDGVYDLGPIVLEI